MLFRRRGLVGWLIGSAGRSGYCHAAMAARWNPFDKLMCLETVQFRGGRAVEVAHRAGIGCTIDVYRVRTKAFDPAEAVEAMLDVTGRPYGWGSLLRASFLHLPVVRLFVSAPADDRTNGSLPFCSQAVARALRAGGVDPVPNLADRVTEPGDLARSAALKYLFTLASEEVFP